jgi:hypothetical protein
MIRPRKDQLFLYERFALGSEPHAQHSGGASRSSTRFNTNEAIRPPPPASKTVREPISPSPSELASLLVTESSKLVHGQQDLIKQLVSTCEKMQQEIDFWKNKAESVHTTQRTEMGANFEGARIDALRKLLARELHPDAANLSPEEAAVRSSLFKTLWPKIDQIVKSGVAN